MKDVFVPYYINGNNIKNLFQIAINRYGSIDVNINRVDTTIELNVPLSELTCGKIIQGSAKITILRSNILTEIDFETKACIDAFINLENILLKNNALKKLNSSSSLSNLSTGDLVEITATISQTDPILNFFQKTLSLLEFQEITDNVNNKQMKNWIKYNISTIYNQKKLKFSLTPAYNSDTNITVSLDTANSIIDVDYYLNRPITIVGQVVNSTPGQGTNEPAYKDDFHSDGSNSRPSYVKDFSKNTIFGHSLKSIPLTNHGDSFNLNAHLLWDYLNTDEKYASFLEHLNYPVDPKLKNKNLEIIPFMIYQ